MTKENDIKKPNVFLLSIIIFLIYILMDITLEKTIFQHLSKSIFTPILMGLIFSIIFSLYKKRELLTSRIIISIGIYVIIFQIIFTIIYANIVPFGQLGLIYNFFSLIMGAVFLGVSLIIVGIIVRLAHEKLKILKYVFVIIFGAILINSGFTNNKASITEQFKEYLTNNYNLILSDKYEVDSTSNFAKKVDLDFYGYFTDIRDPNYVIEVTKKGSEISTTFDKDLFRTRQDIYNYLKKLKGDNLIPGYLDFFPDGIDYKTGSSGSLLDGIIKYQVYLEDTDSVDEQLKNDYKIALFVQDILKSKYNRDFVGIEVIYTYDKKLLEENWMDNYFADSSSNIFNGSNVPTLSDRLMWSYKYISNQITFKLYLKNENSYINKHGNMISRSIIDPDIYLRNEFNFIKSAKESYEYYKQFK
ncbi:MAG: hypothetical protein PHD03_04945 [Bacilli bacterium]|nr:hypothetical protein [Bacilli bacterium]MDD4407377.1 hypothetical protein [Bacilli bacterium]